MKTRYFGSFVLILELTYVLFFWSALPCFSQIKGTKLDPELSDLIQKAAPSEMIPIFVLFKKQGSWTEFENLYNGLTKRERKAQTIAWLKNLSESTFREFESWRQRHSSETDVSFGRRFWLVNGTEAVCTGNAINKIASSPEVSRIYLRTQKPTDFVKSGPKWARFGIAQTWPSKTWKGPFAWEGKDVSWNLRRIRTDHVWSQGYTGRGIIVAVLDSGMNVSHPDIKNNLWVNEGEIPENGIDDDHNGYVDDFLGWNFAEGNQNITDDFFHGTIVGGLIAGDGAGGIVTGVAPQATLMVLKTYAYDLTKKYGARVLWQAFQYDKWLALQYALDNGADVANFSFDYQPSEKPLFAPWRYVLANATFCGLACVAGAGNSRSWLKDPDQITPPADVPEVIAVGGTSEDDRIDRVSSRGPVTWQNIPPFLDFPLPQGLIKPDLCAPIGRCPYISFSSNGYDYLSGEGGTSTSSPHVAGIIALMLEKNPGLMPWEIKTRLEETCVERGWPGKDNYYGWGRVDALDAVNYGVAPNFRLMGWTINGERSLAVLPGQEIDLQVEFMVSACPVSGIRILMNNPDQDLRIANKESTIIFPKPISEGQNFRISIQGAVASSSPSGKKVISRLFLSAERGRKFYFEVPIYIGRSETLIVDDDGDGENEVPVIEGMDCAHRYYHVINTRLMDVTHAILSKYKNIIWVTGEEFTDTLDSREQAVLKGYLDNGGRLLLLGDNIGDDLGETEFYKTYLHAKVIKKSLSGNYARVEFKILGKDGDALSRRMVLPVYVNYKQYDLIRPIEGANDPFQGAVEDSYMGFVRFENRYKLVYTSLGMEAIENREVRATLLDRILDWFNK